MYIGIDQSYRNTGIVTIDDDLNVVTHEVVQTLKSDGDYFTRAALVAETTTCIIKTTDELTGAVKGIGIEGLAFGMRGTTLQQLAGLQFMLVGALREALYYPKVYTPSTVKKCATGAGKASKDDMYDALPDQAKKLFEKITKSNGREDLADAYWIAVKTKLEDAQ
jgi:Holliday junction resolvasome RuvABC endonuclease subunit